MKEPAINHKARSFVNEIVRKWINNPAASGILIFLAAVAAMAVENSPWSIYYDSF